jgi:hypothetical protein
MWNCVWSCLGKIPWWAWAALTLLGALCGLVMAIVTALTAGLDILLAPLILAAGSGILSAYATTILNCIQQCGRR